jgi:multicomponent Na+:H+ antiporter subunit A
LAGRVQNGSLRRYLVLMFGFFAVVVGAALVSGSARLPQLRTEFGERWLLLDLLLAGLAILGAIGSVRARSRWAAILSLGGVGVVMTLIFGLYSAPDLALTNLSVEVLTLVLFGVMLQRLPRLGLTHTGWRVQSARVIGVAAGAVFGLVVWVVASERYGAMQTGLSAMAQQIIASSPTQAQAKNVVNAILVDFRALDTFGEVAVLMGAMVAAAILIRKSRLAEEVSR